MSQNLPLGDNPTALSNGLAAPLGPTACCLHYLPERQRAKPAADHFYPARLLTALCFAARESLCSPIGFEAASPV